MTNNKKTIYEWIAEQMDGEDILDVRHADTLKELNPQEGEGVALTKNVVSESEGLEDRTWAYLDEDGNLPDTFEDGSCIPKRFLQP
tara:strand:+ start:3114 stop:3371 length:258 start_codon:yes stop_codon:yes gene_type:complete